MEHPGGVTGLTPGVTAWTVESIAALPPGERQTIAALVNEAGARSARAQALPTAITSTVRAPEKKKKRLASKMLAFLFFFSECSRFPRTDRARGTSTAYRDRANVRARHDKIDTNRLNIVQIF